MPGKRAQVRAGQFARPGVAAPADLGPVPVPMPAQLAGLELGDRLGTKTGERGELLGGVVLIAVGIAVTSGIL